MNIRIISDGTPTGTQIINSKTGEKSILYQKYK
jgi:hypothetical protein